MTAQKQSLEDRRRVWLRRIVLSLVAIAGTLLLAASWLFDWWKAVPTPSPDKFVFRDGFENAHSLEELMLLDWSRWHGAQQETGGAVEVTTEKVHSGAMALKCVAKTRSGGDFPKADIERSKLRFVKGDHVYSSVWFFLTGGSGDESSTLFLWDLEASDKHNSPGRRLYLQSGGLLASDLGKWWTGKTIRQQWGHGHPFPKDQWVCVRVHLYLSNVSAEGTLEVWQDNVKVLDAHCQTLPSAAAIYDRLQVGITAHSSHKNAVTIYVDDVEISNRGLW